jgi:hypothetical protein
MIGNCLQLARLNGLAGACKHVVKLWAVSIAVSRLRSLEQKAPQLRGGPGTRELYITYKASTINLILVLDN